MTNAMQLYIGVLSVKNMFIGYYRPSEAEFKEMWSEAIFSVDANILLHIYRYSPALRDVLFDLMAKLGRRLWITHQAALEFQKRRLNVISEQAKKYDQFAEDLDKAAAVVRQGKRHHPRIDVEEIIGEFTDLVERQKKRLAALKPEHPDLFEKDELWDKLTMLLEGKVGAPYDAHKRAEVMKAVEARIKNKIPPGYMDGKKQDEDGVPGHGDVLVWLQLMEKVRVDKQKFVIFVTDDAKEDWWLRWEGKIIVPRPELIHEMQAETGARAYLYRSEQFIEHGRQHFGMQVDDKLVVEAADVQRDFAAPVLPPWTGYKAPTRAYAIYRLLLRRGATHENAVSLVESFLHYDHLPYQAKEMLVRDINQLGIESVDDLQRLVRPARLINKVQAPYPVPPSGTP